MEIEFTQRAFKEWEEWKKSGNTKITKRIAELTQAILNPRASSVKYEPHYKLKPNYYLIHGLTCKY